jgi:hypothetical protein
MDHPFKEDRKTVPTLKNSSISPRKNISGTYLISGTHLENLAAGQPSTSHHPISRFTPRIAAKLWG